MSTDYTRQVAGMKIVMLKGEKGDKGDRGLGGGTWGGIEGNIADQTDLQEELALKADASDVNEALALKANTSDVNEALALKADIADVDEALAQKADITTLNGMKLTKIWENPDPTIAFPSQLVDLGEEVQDMMIEFQGIPSSTTMCFASFRYLGSGAGHGELQGMESTDSDDGYEIKHYTRRLTFDLVNGTTRIIFASANSFTLTKILSSGALNFTLAENIHHPKPIAIYKIGDIFNN